MPGGLNQPKAAAPTHKFALCIAQVDLSDDRVVVDGRNVTTAAASILCYFAHCHIVTASHLCSVPHLVLQVDLSVDKLIVDGRTVTTGAASTLHSSAVCLTLSAFPTTLCLMQVDLSVDKLVVDGRKVTTAAASTLCHFAVNKPVGYICSNVSKQPGMRAVDLLQPWLDKWQQKHKVCSGCQAVGGVGRPEHRGMQLPLQ